MSSPNEPARKRPKVLEFGEELGDLFMGPKTPSNQQVLRLMLYFVSVSSTLRDAAKEVVTQVLGKHTSSVSKSAGKLEDDVIALHSEARFKNQLNSWLGLDFLSFLLFIVILKKNIF